MKIVCDKEGISYDFVRVVGHIDIDTHIKMLYVELSKYNTTLNVKGIKPVILDGVFTGVELDVDSFENKDISPEIDVVTLPAIKEVSNRNNVRRLLSGTRIHFKVHGIMYRTKIEPESEIPTLNQLMVLSFGSDHVTNFYNNYDCEYEDDGEWIPIDKLKMKEE